MRQRDWWNKPFRRMVILGESTVQGGGWLSYTGERYSDIVAKLINECQSDPMEYINKGIGANAISMRSPGYEMSAKPSAMERYQDDVIANNPDLFLLCYGLNDMRAAMPLNEFIEDMRTIIEDVRGACAPLIVLTTIYYMNGWKSYPPYDKGSVELTERYNDAIKQLGEEEDCLVSDVWAAEAYADWAINPCGVHANKVGNLLIGHKIFETLANNCSGISEATNRRDMPTEWVLNVMKSREDVGDPYDPWWESK
jgi:lysophospholipase L1-like esterase